MAGIYLKHFTNDQIIITPQDAMRILRFFFPFQPISLNELTDEDIAFAQALLVQAVDSSTEMGYVQILWDKLGGTPPTDFSFIKDLAKAFCKKAARDWFRHATGKDLEDPQIYVSVQATISRNFRSAWTIHRQGGALDY